MSSLIDADTMFHDGQQGVIFTIEVMHYTVTGAKARARMYATGRFPINAFKIDVLRVREVESNPPRRNKYEVDVFVPSEGIVDKLPVDVPGFS